MNFYYQVIIQSLRKSFDFSSRCSRSEFFSFILFLSIIEFILLLAHIHLLKLNFIPMEFDDPFYKFYLDISLFGFLITFPALISIMVRRLNDLNKSRWWYLIIFTIVGVLLLLYWFCKKGDEGENRFGFQSTLSNNSFPLLLSFNVFYLIFYFTWNPNFLYEIESNDEVVINPYLNQIKDRSFLDVFGFGDCVHVLPDGTCFTEGLYKIINEAELTNPTDLESMYLPLSRKTKVRHVSRKILSNNNQCTLDHIEFDAHIDENLFMLVKQMLANITSDQNRCKTETNRPIAIDVYITSPGGYVDFGTLLAIEIKKYGATTHITPNQICASMCTDLFLAGKQRIMHSGSRLQFHSAYTTILGNIQCYKELSNRVYWYLDKELANTVVSDFLNVCNPYELKSVNQGAALSLGFATGTSNS